MMSISTFVIIVHYSCAGCFTEQPIRKRRGSRPPPPPPLSRSSPAAFASGPLQREKKSMAAAAPVYRRVMKAVQKHVGVGADKKHFREFVAAEFRCPTGTEADARARLRLAGHYAYLLTSVQHQKELLFSYNIAVDRSEEMRKTLNKSAASVGLQLPDVYQP